MEYWAMWLVIVILLAIIEFATVNLVSIWFVCSGVIAMIVSLFTGNFLIQFGVFVLLGVILMILTKPMLDKMLHKKDEKINLDRIIGMEGITTETIKPNTVGEVKVDGKRWSAVSSTSIEIDSIVKINAIDGVKLVVEPVETLTEKETKEEKVVKEEVVEEPAVEKKTTPKKSSTSKTKKTTSTAKKGTTTKTSSQKKTSSTKTATKKKTTSANKTSSAKKTTSTAKSKSADAKVAKKGSDE